jgi:hypothetical protein
MDDDVLGASVVIPCLRMRLKMGLVFDGGGRSFENVNLLKFFVLVIDHNEITLKIRLHCLEKIRVDGGKPRPFTFRFQSHFKSDRQAKSSPSFHHQLLSVQFQSHRPSDFVFPEEICY